MCMFAVWKLLSHKMLESTQVKTRSFGVPKPVKRTQLASPQGLASNWAKIAIEQGRNAKSTNGSIVTRPRDGGVSPPLVLLCFLGPYPLIQGVQVQPLQLRGYGLSGPPQQVPCVIIFVIGGQGEASLVSTKVLAAVLFD